MVLCIDIFKCLDFVDIQSWMTLHLTSLKKRKRNHHRFAEQIQQGVITKFFTPLQPLTFSLAETMSPLIWLLSFPPDDFL